MALNILVEDSAPDDEPDHHEVDENSKSLLFVGRS